MNNHLKSWEVRLLVLRRHILNKNLVFTPETTWGSIFLIEWVYFPNTTLTLILKSICICICVILIEWVISFTTVTAARKASVSDLAVHGRFGESFVRRFNLKYRSFPSSWKIDLITRYFFQFFNKLVDIILKSAAWLTSLHFLMYPVLLG